jgi:hypothetical protein
MSGCGRAAVTVGIVWALLGLALLIDAGNRTRVSYRLTHGGRASTARVVDYEQRKRTFYPILVFVAPDGKEVRFTSTAGPRRGDTVPILYDPSNPQVVKVDSYQALWSSNIVEAIVAIVLGLLPGIALVWIAKRDETV